MHCSVFKCCHRKTSFIKWIYTPVKCHILNYVDKQKRKL